MTLIVIPEEAEELFPLIRSAAFSPTSLLTYAAPVTQKMLHFNSLKFYGVPALPIFWKAPLWLQVELGIFSGRLYFEYDEYPAILKLLGVMEQSGKLTEEDEEEEEESLLQVDDLEEKAPLVLTTPATNGTNGTNGSKKAAEEARGFARKPLRFLQEWLAVRRQGQDFSHTPMGFICQGVPLLASHPFFNRIEKKSLAVDPMKTMGTLPTEEDEEDAPDEDFYDENAFGAEPGDAEENDVVGSVKRDANGESSVEIPIFSNTMAEMEADADF